MKKSERFALNHYLSDYPQDKAFFDVIELIETESDLILVWEPFEYTPVDTLTDYICHIAEQIEAEFIDRQAVQK